MPVFCFWITQQLLSHLPKNTSLFIFKVCTNASVQIIYHRPKLSPSITSAQSNAACPIHYIWFTLASASTSASTSAVYAFSLSYIHTGRAHMNHGGMMCYKAWEHSTQCIFHEALDAVLFMLVCFVWETESRTIDSWHSDGGLEYLESTKAHKHSLFTGEAHS